MTVLVDLDVSPRALRKTLYNGNLVILTQVQAVHEFVEYTREELRRLFKPYEPEKAHRYFDKSEMARMLALWKPNFIHSARSQTLVRKIITEANFPAETTHYDVPKPRTSFPVGHLTTGIAYAFPWHRDTWYSAPRQQINWWLPIFPIRDDNSMSFDLASFDREVPNTSHGFDYYRNNAARFFTASQVTSETQARPAAVKYTPVHELVVLPAPGAVLLFSGAQLHKSIPNTSGRSRFSVDFRTVDVIDLRDGCGAPILDAHCSGTAIRDFHNVADGRPFEEATVQRIFGAPPAGSMLVFAPDRPEPTLARDQAPVPGDAVEARQDPRRVKAGVVIARAQTLARPNS